MMTQHPTLDELLSSLDGRDVSPAVSTHLASGCVDCDTASARLRPVLRSLAQDRLEPAPRALKRAALSMIAAERRREAGRKVVEKLSDVIGRVAALLVDSGAAPALAGTRGSAVAPVRHLIFESDDDRFTVRVERAADRTSYELMGQVLLMTGATGSLPVTLKPEKGRARTAESQTTGEFAFANVQPGRYALIVETMDGPITLPGIDLA